MGLNFFQLSFPAQTFSNSAYASSKLCEFMFSQVPQPTRMTEKSTDDCNDTYDSNSGNFDDNDEKITKHKYCDFSAKMYFYLLKKGPQNLGMGISYPPPHYWGQ